MKSPPSPIVRVSDQVGTSDEAVHSAVTDAADDVRVIEVGPTGIDALAPLLISTLDGETTLHAACTTEDARDVVSRLENGENPSEDCYAVVEHGHDSPDFPVPERGPLSVGRRRVTSRCGWTAPADVETYRGEDGLLAERVRDSPADSLETIRKLGLLGRGRGDAATDVSVADQWQTARDATGDPVIVVNANDADPNTLADKLLLESVPLAVLDAASAVGHVVDAASVVAYLNDADEVAAERIHEAIAAVERSDVDFGVNVRVATGPDEYIAGEETMALEAMEGNDRLEARLRPPGPAEFGLHGRPTVVHTPRTLVQVREALVRPEAFDEESSDPGTRLVTVTGDVDSPATVELPTDTPLDRTLDAVDVTESFKMAVVGGQFGGITRRLDVSSAAPALRSADLGTDGVVELFDETACPVAVAGTRASFAREENCGRCVPCREGSKQLTELLRDVYDGEYRSGKIRELARVTRETSICEFGRSVARPVTTAMNEFEEEFDAHADGRCPSGACERGGT